MSVPIESVFRAVTQYLAEVDRRPAHIVIVDDKGRHSSVAAAYILQRVLPRGARVVHLCQFWWAFVKCQRDSRASGLHGVAERCSQCYDEAAKDAIITPLIEMWQAM